MHYLICSWFFDDDVDDNDGNDVGDDDFDANDDCDDDDVGDADGDDNDLQGSRSCASACLGRYALQCGCPNF